MRQLFKLYQFWLGIGVLAISLFLGWGLPMIVPSTPQNGIVITIAGAAVSIPFFIKAYRLYKRQKVMSQPSEEVEQLNLIDTLTAMHRRLIELQKEKAAHTKVSIEVFKKVLPTLADRMGTVKREDWPTFERSMKLQILQSIPPKPYMNIRGRFNFKKWAKLNEQWKEMVYSSAASVATKAKDELLKTKEWTLADGVKIAELVDGYDWGVQKLRDDDPQWKELYESIGNRLRIDNILGGLIKEHIDLSRVYNNITLLVHYSEQFKKDDIYSLMLYEAVVGSPMSPEKVDMGLNEILRKIEKRLSVKTTIVYCCVRGNEYQVLADNQGNDTDTLFVTLGTDSMITGIKALMGASLPTIIEGGLNANFITFKITELPPSVSLGYLIDVVFNARKPYKFRAWSEKTKGNITATFTGECPKVVEVGPVETAPPST